MDFWSRIIGGSRSSPKSTRTTTPTERLTAFKRTCNTLQQLWRSSNTTAAEQAATVHTRNCIERLNTVLSDESRGPAPHPCLSYAASSQIFVTVTKLALSSYDEAVLRSATVFFNTLIDSEVDGVVDNRLFARALVDLVRRADKQSEDVEGRLVELLFGVSNNIRLQPTILPAWFAPRSDDEDQSTGGSGVEFAGTMRTDDFPLFYLLVEYVHHAGRAGDFARTGLLYLIETASRSKDLERWLIESDLATLMATGLGALYSQLGSLTSSSDTESDVPHIITHSDHAHQDTALPPALGVSMDSFMAYLLFWQDTIDHCKSAEVVATLLDHFQVLFLEQLLYPSLLESSDMEGGSTAAVLTYLYRILASLDQEDLVHRILHFLLASHSDSDAQIAEKKKNMSASRRKSLDVLAAFSEEAARPSPTLFNLRDLALLGLRSTNRPTVLATLRLLTVILQRHPSFSRSLVRTIPGQPAMQRTVGALNAELEQLFTLATSIMDESTLDESYGNYLKDASWILESRLSVPTPGDQADAVPFELRQDDPIIRELLGCLGSFFTNTVIVNLALTEVLMSIASSHFLALDGWLLVDPAKYSYTKSYGTSSEGDSLPDILEKVQSVYREPSWSPSDTPALTAILRGLVEQVQGWRKDVADFDILVAARRDLLHDDTKPNPGSANNEQAPVTPPRFSSDRPPSKTPQKGLEQGSSRGRRDKRNLTSPQRSLVGSPLREPATSHSPPSRDVDVSEDRSTAAEELRKRLGTPFSLDRLTQEPTGAVDTGLEEQKPVEEAVSLGHVLTNVVILYEFLLELSAMVQARGTHFQEAGFEDVTAPSPQADGA
ncbi:Retinoic acid induced 16-like protein-domain-containing protein [Aspergillus crustosus]